MIDIRIIPSLLIKNNRVVKGVKFSNHKDAGDPITTCLALESQLADEICIVDLDAYEQKKSPNVDYLRNIVSKIEKNLNLYINEDDSALLTFDPRAINAFILSLSGIAKNESRVVTLPSWCYPLNENFIVPAYSAR